MYVKRGCKIAYLWLKGRQVVGRHERRGSGQARMEQTRRVARIPRQSYVLTIERRVHASQFWYLLKLLTEKYD